MSRYSKMVLGVLLVVTLNLNNISAIANNDGIKIYENESFEEYITNDIQDYFDVSGTADVIVSEISENNKSLMVNKKSVLSSQITKSFESIKGDVIFQFDIKVEGTIFPWSFSLLSQGGKTLEALKIDKDGNIKTAEGKMYGTFGKDKWVNVAVMYSSDKKRYSIYLNRSKKLSNWVLKDEGFDFPSGVTFALEVGEGGDSKVYIDNFRVYNGKSILNDNHFGKKKYNKNSIDYVEKEAVISDRVEMSDNFDNTLVKMYNNGNVLSVDEEENGNKFLHFEEKNGNECYVNYTDGMGLGNQNYTIYSVDVRSTKYSGVSNLFLFQLKPSSTANKTVYISNGVLYLYNGKKVGTMNRNEWQNITLSVDYLTRNFDVFFNGEKVAEDIPFQAKEGGFPSQIRFNCTGGHSNNLDIDNVVVYFGKEPRDIFDKSSISGYYLETTLHYWQLDETPKAILSNKLAYDAITSSVFFNNEKINAEENGAFIDNRIIYLPVEKTAQRLGKKITVQDGKIKYENLQIIINESRITSPKKTISLSAPVIEKNGTIYAPVDAFGTNKMLGEDVFYDDRGVVVFGISGLSDEKEKEIVKFMHFERPSKEEILETYKANGMADVHPRILLTQEDFDAIRNNIANDATAEELYEQASTIYRNIENMPTSVYTLSDGNRLLPVSEEVFTRVLALSYVYRVSGDETYAERAYKELEAVANFPTWHPTHFLDTAKMCQAVSLGYDWLYDYLTEERREILENAMLKFGVKEYLRRYTTKESWSYENNNWAAICNGGSIMLAIALMDKCPTEASAMLEIAIKGLENCLYGFGPDGAWFEGPGYWNATIETLGLGLQTLKSSMNNDYSLSTSAGFCTTNEWAASIAYGDNAFGFGDAASTTDLQIAQRDAMWMGNYFNNPKFQKFRLDAIDRGFTGGSPRYSVYDSMYYVPEFADDFVEVSGNLDFSYRNVEMASTRSSWRDDAMFLAYKGGSSRLKGHNHLDSGTFSLFQDGICWANDYGYDNYNSSGYYQYTDVKPNRWSFYRVSTQGHNCIVINPDDNEIPQDWQAMSKIVRFENKSKGSIGVVDLSSAYARNTKKYIRGYMLDDDRRSAVIRDEMILSSNSDVYWFMHTGISGDENFEINGNSVIITHPSGEKLYLEFVTNAPKYEIYTMNSEFLPSFKNPGKNMWAVEGKKIVIKLKGQGNINLTTKMYDSDLIGVLPKVEDKPISEWSIPEGERKKAPVLENIYQDGEAITNFNENVVEYMLDVYYEDDYSVITAKSPDGSRIIERISEDGSEYKFKVVSLEDESFFSNYTVKMRKVPHIYKDIVGFERLEPKSITASRVPEAANPPKNVNDGNMATRFAVDGDNEWIELDYGKVLEADAFAVAYYKGTERISYYDILVSEDGKKYTTIFSGSTSGVTDYYELYTIDKIKVRYLKLVGHMSSAGAWNSPTEIALLVKEGE